MAKSKKKAGKPKQGARQEDEDAEPDYAPAKASTGHERWLLVPVARLADLLRGVVAVCGDDAFPTDVAVTRDAAGKTAKVGVQLQEDECNRIKRLFFPGVTGVGVEFHYGTGGVRPLREVIRPTFTMVDLAAEANALRPADRRAYLFAATTERQAQELLAALVSVTTPGIRVRPLTEADSPPRFHSLWLVEGRHPPRAAFDAAGRAWWTSAAERDRGSPVFLPYPYRSDIGRDDLDRIDWNVENGFVLLNADDGPCLIRIAGDAPATLPLIGVTAIQADARPARAFTPTDATRPFDVTLRLVPRTRAGTPTHRLLERIRELELDIDQRKQTVDRLSAELTLESESLPTFYTPLFAYRQRGDDVPAELRRLVVEWADQKQLRDVMYARIRGDSLPERFSGGADFHLLTTPTALTGRPEQDGRDLWLREYAPSDGLRFDLQPTWVHHDLRLFLPDDPDRRMELYPEIDGGLFGELRPGEMAAERLGVALCGKDEPTDFLFLLLPGTEANPAATAVRVPKAAFRPLVESFPWRCGVVVPDKPAEAVEHDLKALVEAFVEGVDDAFGGALGAIAGRRITARQEDFVREIQVVNREFDDRRRRLNDNRARFDREYEERRKSLDELRKKLTELDDLLFKAGAAVGFALADGATLKTPLREVVGDTERTKQYLEAIGKLTAEIGDLARQAAALEAAAARYTRGAEDRP